ncbi:60s acidic ribosomal protein-domain-containing protein [Phaeosphaeriaceae sp. PMI808]|nr:60s acidic ribosomal protein-domain-containing protein [Phaeosphaeriaceae sp. PMI808]
MARTNRDSWRGSCGRQSSAYRGATTTLIYRILTTHLSAGHRHRLLHCETHLSFHTTILTTNFTMSTSELAASYAALILADDGVDITSDKLQSLIKAAKIEDVEPIWTTLFAKALEGKDVKDLLLNVGSGGGAAAAPAAGGAGGAGAADAAPAEEEKEEEKEESDDDMGFGLFD